MIPSSFPPPQEIARLSARMLLQAQAVAFAPDAPYTLTSGMRSPVYIDCRRVIAYPRIRALLMDFLAITVMRTAGPEAFDNIAGGETAGIPFAALVAERLALPMSYIRKQPKGHGRLARIEGAMELGQRVLLVEDLTTDGGSKVSFVRAIRDAGGQCHHAAVIFRYGIFPKAEARLARHEITLSCLCDWWDVLREAQAQGAFEARALRRLESFLKAPQEWQDSFERTRP